LPIGRVGENGQDNLSPSTTLDAAVRLFTAKFKSKTKVAFENRYDPAKPGIPLA
jgi:WGR domain